ncbi:MAG: hypothetical protein Q4D51_08345 [Eubacteriales bacterium]|nr:hypothetical protein [Eubacteriales bacterium]
MNKRKIVLIVLFIIAFAALYIVIWYAPIIRYPMKELEKVLLFLLGMTLTVFAYHVKEFVVNGAMIPWAQFTPIFAMITIGFAGIAKNKKKVEKVADNQ